MKNIKNISFLILLVIMGMGLSFSAYAMDLQSARDMGAVGERLDGYVAVLTPSSEIDALVTDVNQKRRAEYARISEENKQPIDIVAKLASRQIIERLAASHYYQAPDGSWKQK